ncbi:MAG: amidoligase family protein [Victivallaceae bacterium]
MSNNTMATAKALTFGTELEYTNISRERAAKAIHAVVGGAVRYTGGGYDAWTVTAPDGREWRAISDASLGGRATSAEVVTPILKWEDVDTLQAVVRELRKAGAKATDATSQHVHIGVADFNARQIANLARIFYKQEELILKAVGTWEHRLNHYTRRTDRAFIERLEAAKPKTRETLNRAWFGYANPNPAHYDSARYRALNLNNVWRIGTAEFRIFNGTTHAGEVKTNIILCLAIAALAKTARAASSKNQRPYTTASAKYDTRVFLLRLGMIGGEFKNTRMHLLKRLPGSAAWKNGRPEAR